jgi:hypothetical protein
MVRLARKDEFVINRPLQSHDGDLRFDGRLRGFEGVEAGEQAVYVRDSEECLDTTGQAGDAEGAAVALA